MKHLFALILLLSWSSLTVQADDLRDNSFHLDSDRIEQNQEGKEGDYHQDIAPLFSLPDHQRLLDTMKKQEEQFASEKGQLFSHVLEVQKNKELSQLFTAAPQIQQVNRGAVGKSGEREEGLLSPAFLYLLLSLGALGLAGLLSYRLYGKDVKDESH